MSTSSMQRAVGGLVRSLPASATSAREKELTAALQQLLQAADDPNLRELVLSVCRRALPHQATATGHTKKAER